MKIIRVREGIYHYYLDKKQNNYDKKMNESVYLALQMFRYSNNKNKKNIMSLIEVEVSQKEYQRQHEIKNYAQETPLMSFHTYCEYYLLGWI